MPQWVHRSFAAATRAACLALLCWGAPAWCAPPANEYQVKAVYLFNFGQFVEWPATAYESADSPFVIGIVGDDPFGRALEDVVRGESLNGRTLVVKRFADPASIDACNIVFVGRNESALLDRTLRTLQGRSVLTVTDIAGAEHRGAVIALVNENQRIRMRINLAAAKANNLVISSKLLRPAEIVGAEGNR